MRTSSRRCWWSLTKSISCMGPPLLALQDMEGLTYIPIACCLLLLSRLQHSSPHHLPKSSTRDVIQQKKHTKSTKQNPPYHVQQFSIRSYPFFVETVTSLSGGHYMKPTQTITREIPHKFTIPLPCLIPSKKKVPFNDPCFIPIGPHLKSRSNCCNSEVSVTLSEGSSAPADSRWKTTSEASTRLSYKSVNMRIFMCCNIIYVYTHRWFSYSPYVYIYIWYMCVYVIWIYRKCEVLA